MAGRQLAYTAALTGAPLAERAAYSQRSSRFVTDGRYVYALQASPREGDADGPGVPCQIGQLVVVDALVDRITSELPLLYRGPSCSDSLLGTDEETVEPSHTRITPDGSSLFILTAGGYQVTSARSRQELVVDLSDPAQPFQLPSIPVGTSTGDHGDALGHDGRSLYITNTEDDSVSKIDTQTRSVVATIQTIAKPLTVATFGPDGPGDDPSLRGAGCVSGAARHGPREPRERLRLRVGPDPRVGRVVRAQYRVGRLRGCRARPHRPARSAAGPAGLVARLE